MTIKYKVEVKNSTFSAKYFDTLLEARMYIENETSRNKQDGHDQYWNSLKYTIYKVIEEEVDIDGY